MPDQTVARRHTAGAFDIRNIIGGLLLAYGVILTLMGVFGDPELEKTTPLDGGEGINANLWAGIALLVVGAVFVLWALLRPIVVEVTEDDDKPAPMS